MIASYCRVSTAQQKEKASIETQVASIRKYCRDHGLDLRDEFCFQDDGISGMKALDSRLGGKALLKAVASGSIDTLLVWDLERLARDSEDAIAATNRFTRSGITIIAVRDSLVIGNTPSSRLNAGIRAVMAQHDLEQIRLKTMEGKKRLAPEGCWLGGTTTFGYRAIRGEDRHTRLVLATDPIPGLDMSEADVMSLLYRLGDEGRSCQKIADHLNARGIPAHVPGFGKRSKTIGKCWTPARVRRRLINPIYKGELYWGKRRTITERGERQHLLVNPKDRWIMQRVPAIVDAELWERVNSILHSNQLAKMSHARNDYLLRQLIRCALCGRRYIGTRSHYRCVGRHSARKLGETCAAAPLRRQEIEAIVWEDVLHFIEKPGLVIRDLQRQLHKATVDQQPERDRAKLATTLAHIAWQNENLATLLTRGVLKEEDFQQQRSRLTNERAAVEKQLVEIDQLRKAGEANVVRLRSVGHLLDGLREGVDKDIPFAKRRSLVELLVDEVLVQQNGSVAIRYRFEGHMARWTKSAIMAPASHVSAEQYASDVGILALRVGGG